MNGDLGWFTIKPDQMQVINPFLILVFIPLYEMVFYPLLNLIGIRRPLQKITLGGIFAGVAFLCSMGVEIIIEPTYPILPVVGESQFRIFNAKNCVYDITTNLGDSAGKFNLQPNAFFVDHYIQTPDDTRNFSIAFTTATPGCDNYASTGSLESGKANSFFLTGSGSTPSIVPFEDDPDKSRKGAANVRVLANIASSLKIFMRNKDGEHYNETASVREIKELAVGDYEIQIGTTVVKSDVKFRVGGVYTVLIHDKSTGGYVS